MAKGGLALLLLLALCLQFEVAAPRSNVTARFAAPKHHFPFPRPVSGNVTARYGRFVAKRLAESAGLHYRNETSLVPRSDHGHGHGQGESQSHEDVEMDDDEEALQEGSSGGSHPSDDDHDPPPPPITPVSFQNFVTKGKQLYDWMSERNIQQLTEKMKNAKKLKAGESSQSKFIGYKDLAANGWSKNPNSEFKPEEVDLEKEIPVSTILETLKISTDTTKGKKGGSNIAVNWVQDDSEFNGKHHERVSPYHCCILNV